MKIDLACGYKGDAVCEPPNCSGACPSNKPDLRPERPLTFENGSSPNMNRVDVRGNEVFIYKEKGNTDVYTLVAEGRIGQYLRTEYK